MRLKQSQRAILLEWIAEGLESGEINSRAAEFKPAFEVTRQQVDYYRKTRADDIGSLKASYEHVALNTGLALKAGRVSKLKELAELMELDLFGDLLWTRDVKGVGSGPIAEIVEFEEFNAAEVREYRGVLDDIAKEVGHRAQRQEITGADGDSLSVRFLWQDDDSANSDD